MFRKQLKSFQAAKEEIAFYFSIFIAVRAMDCIFANRRCVFFTYSAFFGLCRVGSAYQFTKVGNRIIFFKYRGNDGTAAHKFGKLAVKRTCCMYFIEFF